MDRQSSSQNNRQIEQANKTYMATNLPEDTSPHEHALSPDKE